MNARVPAEVFSPGEILKAELHKRGWTQTELSEILGRPPRVVSEVISAKRAITPETAKGLAAALGTSAELWMNLESSYQLSKHQFETSKVKRRARLYGKFPVKEMIRRGWVQVTKDMDRLEREFSRYFSISSIDEAPKFAHAAKKHLYLDAPQLTQLAWLIRAEQIAKPLKVKPFSIDGLKKAIKELKDCLKSVDDVRRAPAILAKAGVRFVVVEFLPGAKLDGACFWIDHAKAPVIALSLRHDRLDNFWHTLFHEVDHVLHGEGKDAPILDVFDIAREEKEIPEQEARANLRAANFCIDRSAIEDWIARTGRVFSRREIVAFAESMKVHPALVVGQLQHRGVIPYSFHRDLLEKVRTVVVDSAVTDGFRTAQPVRFG